MNKALATAAGLVAGMASLASATPEPQKVSKPQKYHWTSDSCGRKNVLKRRAKEKHRRHVNMLKRRNGWK